MRAVVALGLGVAVAAQAGPPADLTALLRTAHADAPVTAWCRGEFRPGRRNGFAAALSAADGGRYVLVEPDGELVELARFAGGADLACYSRSEADRLNRSLARSETLHGRLVPRWTTTVVCGFIENTSAVCWQYSPTERRYVKVGEWIT